MIFHPYAGADLRGPIFTIFGLWDYTADVIIHVKFQVDRSKGFGSTGTRNRVFPTDFDRRPYGWSLRVMVDWLIECDSIFS